MTKILHLTLKKKWFDLIKSGEKKIEYREIKPYWRNRLLEGYLELSFDGKLHKRVINPKKFDEIHFKNGYRKDSPFMRVEWKGLDIKEFEGKECLAIKLGKVFEVKE